MPNESIAITEGITPTPPLKYDPLTTAIMLAGGGIHTINPQKLKEILNQQTTPTIPNTRRSIRNLFGRNLGSKSIRNETGLE